MPQALARQIFLQKRLAGGQAVHALPRADGPAVHELELKQAVGGLGGGEGQRRDGRGCGRAAHRAETVGGRGVGVGVGVVGLDDPGGRLVALRRGEVDALDFADCAVGARRALLVALQARRHEPCFSRHPVAATHDVGVKGPAASAGGKYDVWQRTLTCRALHAVHPRLDFLCAPRRGFCILGARGRDLLGPASSRGRGQSRVEYVMMRRNTSCAQRKTKKQ